jgi:hypothetical protein
LNVRRILQGADEKFSTVPKKALDGTQPSLSKGDESMATKIKAKKAKRPGKSLDRISVIKGVKKAPASKGEVAGHTSPGAYYLCWNCGRLNWVPWGWNYFHCWYCGALNLV